jgi:hypothetical protein
MRICEEEGHESEILSDLNCCRVISDLHVTEREIDWNKVRGQASAVNLKGW